MSSATSKEAATNFTGCVQLTAGEGSGPCDAVARTVVIRRFSFTQGQDALRAVRGPRRDETSVIFSQRLRGEHACTMTHRPGGRAATGRPRQTSTGGR